jgi:class 3 adenylate cyclase/predicted ATPase
MDVGDWLRSLGLGQYETLFRENDIDAEVLSDLTDGDLEKFGVSFGHRKRLLKAIASLAAAQPGAKPATSVPPPTATGSAERRPITVMFCDLVGSTSLAARLDPEDWRNLVGSYLDAASAAVTSLGGHVLKKLGDGLMALFGYPQAQENDGERAVRAALAIQRALVDLNSRNAATGSPALAARIGLESGPVVVDHTGEVYGEAPNVAARVQSAAAPGEIWITRGVHRQIAGLFIAEDKGEHELKGVPEKTQLYRIVRVSGGGRRGGSRAPTPLVGRGEELDILARRWERARRGEGQLVLITGEPGLGKSRLIEEFRARLAETPHTWIEWASSQLLQNTPLHPAAEWGRARFGGAEVAGEKRFAELEAALGSVGLDAGEYAPLLAPVIDAPTPPGRAPKLSPEELRSRQLAALSAWVLAGARTQPLVLAFEDLHWADPTSLDVLQALAERGAQASLLIIATTRPEFRPSWKLRSHHGVISLAPLDVGEVARMIGEISTLHALSKDVIAGVSERSGGVPLFVEEVTRLLLERGEHGGVQAIPPTLQQSLAARLDRLGPAREIAQIGAVLGRAFSYALLKSVAAVDDRGQTGVSDPGHSFLDAALEKLADAELLFVEGVAPNANYRFKHALIQDAAYDSLLKSRRQTLHRRAAEVLLASPAPEAEALAHHFTLGGQTELAIEWWGKAGDQALRRSAFAEAISHLGKAIELSDKAGGTAKPREAAATASASQRLKLQTTYGQAVMWSKGYAAEETKAAFARVAELATETGDGEALFETYYSRWGRSIFRGELGLAREAGENFLREAERSERPTEAGVGHRFLGSTLFLQGDFEGARARFEQTLRIHDPDRDREAKFRFGVDNAAVAIAFLAVVTWWMGDFARGWKLLDEAVARAVESAHAPTRANAYSCQVLLEILRDDAEATRRAAETCRAVSREHGLALWLAIGTLASAWARANLGDRDVGSAELQQALADYASAGNKLFLPLFHGLLAEIQAEGRGAEAALAGIDEALALAGETGEHLFDAALYRIRGEILLKQNPADSAAAEAAFLAAIAVAQQQKARSFELRAALSLAKLYQSIGRSIDAHDILGPALAGFSPTPEFPQIAEAKARLEALAADEMVKVDVARRAQRLKLQTNYGQAVMWSKGYAAEETKAAYLRIGELATGPGAAEAPLDAYYALSVNSLLRGEYGSARKSAESFLREAERAVRPTEMAAAHRILGLILLWQGDFREAREHLQEVLRIYDPVRDHEAKFRLGPDSKASAISYLSLVAWCSGDIGPAREFMDEAVALAIQSDHPPTLASVHLHKAVLEILRDDADAALRDAETDLALGREHGLALYLAFGSLISTWARGELGHRDVGSPDYRRALTEYAGQSNKLCLPFYRALLAKLEAEQGSVEAALAEIDGALALSGETGERWFDAGLHRIRGEILIKQNPAEPALAEAAFLAAIAVAQQQKARSFEQRAALSLAKLYESTGRPIDAHDVLGPALAGFSPTPEFPQIAEAKALFDALAATKEVKDGAARRAQRLKLQANYGQAVMLSKGYAAEETRAAFARVGELATEIGKAEAPFEAYFGRWPTVCFAASSGRPAKRPKASWAKRNARRGRRRRRPRIAL